MRQIGVSSTSKPMLGRLSAWPGFVSAEGHLAAEWVPMARGFGKNSHREADFSGPGWGCPGL